MEYVISGRFIFVLYWFIRLFCNLKSEDHHKQNLEALQIHSTSIVPEDGDSLLVLSLLDGSFVGVDHMTGQIRWTLNNEPVVKVPWDVKRSMEPIFLPDPKDGSLYLLANGRKSALKKLPFTIQQLVASSPCRSNDGMFYTGKKVDTWFAVNWKTGKKQDVLNFDKLERSCPVTSTLDNLFIGRAEYNILMYDSKQNNRHWNITYFDYSSTTMTSEEILNYDFVHFGGSATGRVITYKRGSGHLLWDLDLGSPLVAVFLRTNQEMLSVPFTSVEDTTLSRLALANSRDQLLPSLYIGEHKHGLYALPTLVSQQSPALYSEKILLIEGPNSTADFGPRFTGLYPVPEYSTAQLQITGRSDVIISPKRVSFNGTKVRGGEGQVSSTSLPLIHVHSLLSWLDNIEHKPLYFFILFLIAIVTGLFFYVRAQVQAMQLSQRSSQGSARESSGSTVTAVAERLHSSIIQVGKIQFDTSSVLGKGCEGTIVFKGKFESRDVAVKRLLPECFTMADREVMLLRESDAHPNVVRYFCTEQDTHFRYIALELCDATLQDYVEKRVHRDILSGRELLAQATAGLFHLHTLNIVHRDIKPHNVLLSVPNSCGKVRAMISDFGLCKKLQEGRASLSSCSGATGTFGWIAPEIINGNSRIMCHVDIFSLGCVFYYVMSGGKHPFGDTDLRQANILSNHFRLSGLQAVWRSLIECMVSPDPHSRPSANVILSHPALWDNSKILSFLQDVSDRVEKEEVVAGGLLERLERGAHQVCVDGDWRAAVDKEVTDDLRKYRTYRGNSVRDLLRALRNKKHHFRELSKEAQDTMGLPPDKFTEYWLSRFPLLLPHSWTCLQCLRDEPVFSIYYIRTPFLFPPTLPNSSLPSWWYELINSSPSKPSSLQRRGSDGKTTTETVSITNLPVNFRKTNVKGPINTYTVDERDEIDKENWMKSGQEKGVYRPRIRKRTKKQDETSDFVWKTPPP